MLLLWHHRMPLDDNELYVFCQHSNCVIKKDMIISACCIWLPLSTGPVSQRVIILFGKHDDLQVSQLNFSLLINRT